MLTTLLLCSAQGLELHFIDVGQGDAVLIRNVDGRSILYDGGRDAIEVLAYLRSVGVQTIDLVIASHADADHIGGLAAVIEAYRPRYFMDNGLSHSTETYRRLMESVLVADSLYLEPTARTIGLGDVSIRVLPPPGEPTLGQNDNSVGILLEFGSFRAALTGDATGSEFEWWSRQFPHLLPEVTVYKASHHGSSNGDTRSSVSSFRPQTIIISVGAGNAYGHPTEATTRLYRSVAERVLRTDLNGSILVQANQDGSFRLQAARDEPLPPAVPVQATVESAGRASAGPGSVYIECVLFDPDGPDGPDDGREVVTLRATRDVDLTGWWLVDEKQHDFPLPVATLPANESLKVPNPGRPVWNNGGDTVYLYDASRNLVDSLTYPGSGSRACR